MTADERLDIVRDLNALSDALRQASRVAEVLANKVLAMKTREDKSVSAPPS
jgi:hypothetical protein